MIELTRIENQSALENTKQHYEIMTAFVREQMQQGTDFGVIPGTKGKPTLLKPGAEKLCRLLNLRPTFELIDSIVDFDKPLFHYHYRCTLYHQQELVGQAEGNCNSYEKKYKKQEYKVFDLTNTICKIAQKRSLIAAVLCTVGASEFFTQDLEDIDVEPDSKNNRKVRNITLKTHQSNDKSSTNTNSLSPEDWYER
ncbi:MAG: hypothetical protein AB4041_13290, partial [Microcystaceae cyanobacterium]